MNEDNETAMFVTLLYTVYDPNTGEMAYANGGHPTPLVVHGDGSTTELPLTGGIALGVMPNLEYKQDSYTLAPNDTLVLYTDGVSGAIEFRR